jgi:cobyrinic acid a,c-diamide synthase
VTASRPGLPAWTNGEGHVQRGVHASYLHLHWAGVPGVAERFVDAAAAYATAAA